MTLDTYQIILKSLPFKLFCPLYKGLFKLDSQTNWTILQPCKEWKQKLNLSIWSIILSWAYILKTCSETNVWKQFILPHSRRAIDSSTQDIYNLMEVDEIHLPYITLWNICAARDVEIQKRGAILFGLGLGKDSWWKWYWTWS